MKKSFFICALAALCFSCGNKSAETASNESVSNEKENIIAPRPCEIDLNNLADGNYTVEFSYDSINWDENVVSMTIYSENLYDAKDIASIQAGSKVMFNGEEMTVDSLRAEGEWVSVFGKPFEYGVDFWKIDENTYRGAIEDDHSTYTEVGVTKLPLADNLVMFDCTDDPADEQLKITSNIKEYLLSLPDYKREFICLDTEVTVKNGKIVKINRTWIP